MIMKSMNLKIRASAALFSAIVFASHAQTVDNTVMVGGKSMYPTKNIIENTANSKIHTTFVAIINATGQAETLQSKGPFTVFAPVNDAFENLPEGIIESLLTPENKPILTIVVTYHVISGQYNYLALEKLITAGKGTALLKTVSGGTLTFIKNGPHNIIIKDETGNIASISTYDVVQSNGVVHVIDSVLLPK